LTNVESSPQRLRTFDLARQDVYRKCDTTKFAGYVYVYAAPCYMLESYELRQTAHATHEPSWFPGCDSAV